MAEYFYNNNIATIILCFLTVAVFFLASLIRRDTQVIKGNCTVLLYSFVVTACSVSARLNYLEHGYTVVIGMIVTFVTALIFGASAFFLGRDLIRSKKQGINQVFSFDEKLKKLADKKDKNDKTGKIPFFKRVLYIIVPVISLSYMVTVFGVCETFFANLTDMNFVFYDFLKPMLIVFLASTVFMTLLGALIFRREGCKAFASFFGAICILAYIQNIAFNDKKILDGSAFNVKFNCGVFGFVNMLIWIAVCTALFILLKRFRDIYKYVIAASGLILVMQLVPLFVMIAKAPDDALKKTNCKVYLCDGAGQFEISKNENVMVFIMDTFSAKDLSDLINKNEEYKEKLSDFVFYDNIGTESYYTSLSVPSLMTAKEIDYSIPLQDAYKKCWENQNAVDFYKTLHDDGYNVRYYTDTLIYSGGAENMIGKIDNIKMQEYKYITESMPTYRAMLRLSEYKYAPNFMKVLFIVQGASELNAYTSPPDEYIYDTQQWSTFAEDSQRQGLAYYNYDVYNGIKERTTVSSDEKLFTFMHTWGMHEPYYRDGDIDNHDFLTAEEASAYCVDILLEYMDRLKENGCYENSTIILTADHGVHDVYKSSPVMLIKPKGYTAEEMTVNSAPGLLQTDLLPTLLDIIGEDPESIGTSLLRLDEGAERTRVIMDLEYDRSFPECPKTASYGSSSFNCYTKYQYTGRVGDSSVYVKEGQYPISDYWW